MKLTEVQYREMLARTQRNMKREPEPERDRSHDEDMEDNLQRQILGWADGAWPRVKYICPRMDKKSTIKKGIQDITLFLPGGRVLCVECKSRTGKLSDDQLIWRKEMGMNGHTVHEVRSFEQFLSAVRELP